MKKTEKIRIQAFRLIFVLAGITAIIAVISKGVQGISRYVQEASGVYYAELYTESSGGNKSGDVMNILNNSEENPWNLVLVNKWNVLSGGYSVQLKRINNGHSVDARIYPDLQEMMTAARNEGLSPLICSSYRSYAKQQSLFNNKISEYLSEGYAYEQAQEEAGKWVAPPGASEHHTGLALDIVSASYQKLDAAQENTPEQKWLMENSYKYGFILRYPNNKSKITGINYEPWHYRYVGKKAAREIYQRGICLEEYLEESGR